jgi:hypothetical protein
MTSNRGAGFSSSPRSGGGSKFDPLGGPGRSPLAPGGGAGGPGGLLQKKGGASPEEAARDMERRVHALLEESAAAHAGGDNKQGAGARCGAVRCGCVSLLGSVPFVTKSHIHALNETHLTTHTWTALEKALEARKRERALTAFRESKGVADYGGPELTFAAELQVGSCWGGRSFACCCCALL